MVFWLLPMIMWMSVWSRLVTSLGVMTDGRGSNRLQWVYMRPVQKRMETSNRILCEWNSKKLQRCPDALRLFWWEVCFAKWQASKTKVFKYWHVLKYQFDYSELVTSHNTSCDLKLRQWKFYTNTCKCSFRASAFKSLCVNTQVSGLYVQNIEQTLKVKPIRVVVVTFNSRKFQPLENRSWRRYHRL